MNGRIHILARLIYHGNVNRLWVFARGLEELGSGERRFYAAAIAD
jgi:hypothetical protein